MTRKTLNILSLSLLSASIGAADLVAQQDGAKSKADTPISTYTSTSALIGAPVQLEASMKAKEEAREAGEEAEQPTAEVTEWLVDTKDGTLTHAVVSVGGFIGIGDKIVLVPSKNLEWNHAMERFRLGWTEEQLKSQPAFDLDKACKEGLDRHCLVEKASMKERAAKDASAEKQADRMIEGTVFMRLPSRMMRASELAALPVYAGPDSFGATSDLIVDRTGNKVVLAVVNNGSTLGAGGTDYLISYPHFTLCEKDDDHILCATECTVAKLKESVKFEKPKNGAVDPAAAERALDGGKAGKKDERRDESIGSRKD